MRESFSVLDRSNSGTVTAQDVSQALADLGLDNSSTSLAQYFPPGTSSLNLASYLSTLTRDFLKLDRRDQVMAAFSAFDADDNGQIDVAELREALMTTMPVADDDEFGGGRVLSAADVDAAMEGFVGRRVLRKGQIHAGGGGLAMGKGAKGGDVFRYGDFATNVWGSNANGRGSEEQSLSG
jgi:Ca2+-binding EF-hand superfamily protein